MSLWWWCQPTDTMPMSLEPHVNTKWHCNHIAHLSSEGNQDKKHLHGTWLHLSSMVNIHTNTWAEFVFWNSSNACKLFSSDQSDKGWQSFANEAKGIQPKSSSCAIIVFHQDHIENLSLTWLNQIGAFCLVCWDALKSSLTKKCIICQLRAAKHAIRLFCFGRMTKKREL